LLKGCWAMFETDKPAAADAGNPRARRGAVKAVLLDRDGVINYERKDYVKSREEMDFIPGAADAIRRLNDAGYLVIIITNQSPIGRGIFDRRRLSEIHDFMRSHLEKSAGAHVDHIFFCPHRPDEGCGCRKPRPGMIFQAAELYQLDLSNTYFVGDSGTDRKAAEAAGCLFIMVGGSSGKVLGDAVDEIVGPEKIELNRTELN